MEEDDDDAFARFRRNQSTFKEKNKVEIKLDTRYDVSQPGQTVEKKVEKAAEKVEKAADKVEKAADKVEKAAEKEKDKEKEDEQGWTQSQQKALEA